ncbi:ABC transporter permease [Streptomyces sp. NPDC006365]|uniref:ABC transporter permease n=1 Tax=Streptomyces sp. NPDC006365 TaxID=3364744 RepID=UPI00368ADDAC
MSALGRVVRSGVGRKRVQTAVMVLTTLLSVAASVLALGLLEASQKPFEKAFARQQGAHLTAEFKGVSEEQVTRTASAAGVSATAGPFPVASLRLGAGNGPGFFEPPPLTVVGRASAEPALDKVSLTEGRWAKAPGEIVLEADARNPNMYLGAELDADGTTLTVVGIAESVGESADAWVVPAQLTELAAQPSYQMLYRFTDAAGRGDIADGRKAVAAGLPKDALAGTQSYLDVKQEAEASTSSFIPFITAFALLGLALSVLVISIVVSGAVSSATRRIGILKALGFTPSQVGRAYVAQALIPSAVGAALGAVLGNLLAVPLMAQVAQAYRTGTLAIPLWVSVVVPLGVLAVVAVTALAPALRAARLRTAAVLSVGRFTVSSRGRGVRRLLGRLPLPRPVTLGLAGPLARPSRSATMAGAVAFGALAVTFAVGLGSSLLDIQRKGDADQPAGEVTVQTLAPPEGGRSAGPPEPADPAAVAAAIGDRPETESYYSAARADVTVSGLKGGTSVVTYSRQIAEASQPMTEGRWFGFAGEAVVPSRFLQVTGKEIGDTLTLSEQGRTVRLKIVGEVFDLSDEGMTVRTSQASLSALGLKDMPPEFSVSLKSGTDPAKYAAALNADLEPLGALAGLTEEEDSEVLLAMQALIAMLTLMLVTVACLGVLNTVVLDTRDRVRDLGVFKALGMTPRQTITQVLTSVAGIGAVAGAIGVPLGVALHGWVLPEMGDTVSTEIPQAFIDVYGIGLLVLLGLAGVGIAVAGALLPAGWAAKTATGRALRAE